jgi:hypothetical protein
MKLTSKEKEIIELERLNKLYDEVYEKYNKRLNSLTAKRDYEISYIWNEICKLQKKSSHLKNRSVNEI